MVGGVSAAVDYFYNAFDGSIVTVPCNQGVAVPNCDFKNVKMFDRAHPQTLVALASHLSVLMTPSYQLGSFPKPLRAGEREWD